MYPNLNLFLQKKHLQTTFPRFLRFILTSTKLKKNIYKRLKKKEKKIVISAKCSLILAAASYRGKIFRFAAPPLCFAKSTRVNFQYGFYGFQRPRLLNRDFVRKNSARAHAFTKESGGGLL